MRESRIAYRVELFQIKSGKLMESFLFVIEKNFFHSALLPPPSFIFLCTLNILPHKREKFICLQDQISAAVFLINERNENSLLELKEEEGK